MNGAPSWAYAGASAPRADVVSLDNLSDPRLRMALRRASARAAALDIMVGDEHESTMMVEDGSKRTSNARCARRVATVRNTRLPLATILASAIDSIHPAI